MTLDFCTHKFSSHFKFVMQYVIGRYNLELLTELPGPTLERLLGSVVQCRIIVDSSYNELYL